MNLFAAHPTEQDLALFAGGELGPLSRWRIERHLESCGACKTEAAEYFHLSDKLSVLAEVPDVDWDALAHNIRVAASHAAPEPRPAATRWIWGASAAFASALCVLLVVQVTQKEQPTSSLDAVNSPLAITAQLETQVEEPQNKQKLGFAVALADRKESGKIEGAVALASPSRDSSDNEAKVARGLEPLGQAGGRARALPAEKSEVATELDALRDQDSFRGVSSSDVLASIEWSSPDAQITAEGRLSFRSFDAGSGVMTITEYYAP